MIIPSSTPRISQAIEEDNIAPKPFQNSLNVLLKQWKRRKADQFSELVRSGGSVVLRVAHMATKLSRNPVGPGLDVKGKFAESSSVTVVPRRNWKYALLIVCIYGHYHLCARLQLLSYKPTMFIIWINLL